MRVFRLFLGVGVMLFLLLGGCANLSNAQPVTYSSAVQARMELVVSAQKFEQTLGWKSTENFHYFSEQFDSFTLCLYTGIADFNLAALPLGEPCGRVNAQFDYNERKIDALAGIKTPLLPLLAGKRLARFLNVVFHEDYHEQISRIPSMSLNESATTLMGLLAARDFAFAEYGHDSAVARELASDINQYLNSSIRLLHTYRELSDLYLSAQTGLLSREDVLSRKADAYVSLKNDCRVYETWSLGSCVVVTNNAEMADMLKYSSYYPLFYRMHFVCGGNTKKTGLRIIALTELGLQEDEFVGRVKEIIANGCAN